MIAGAPGTGKSTALWQFYYDHWDKKSPTFIFDSEGKMRGVHDLFGDKIPDDVTILKTTKFTDIIKALDEVIIPAFAGKEESWGLILIDMVDKWWEKAQEYWMQKMAGDESLSFAEHAEKMALERKIKKEETGRAGSQSPFDDGFVDWVVVKRWHNGRLLEHILGELPCHVVATAGVREIRPAGEYMEDPLGMRTMWKVFQQIPEGEKKNSYRFTTIMGLQVLGLMEPEWKLHLIKDRSRTMGKRIKYFVNDLGEDENGVVDMWLEWSSETEAPNTILTTEQDDAG